MSWFERDWNGFVIEYLSLKNGIVLPYPRKNPYAIENRNGKFVVIQSETGEVLGTHDTRDAAEAQLRALYAHTEGDM